MTHKKKSFIKSVGSDIKEWTCKMKRKNSLRWTDSVIDVLMMVKFYSKSFLAVENVF